ncbi:MAG: hypothetical protein CSB13_01385 [Chloroflexi bacterium]|nr:MAG: hypothetical protein CSB13_01385 [Chloroflexota bacterium]
MERLDSVVSPVNWSDSYRVVEIGNQAAVECTLTVCGVSKTDVGTAGDSAEAAKAAYSDALKRAAVKFGIGRYLYSLPKKWVDYDAERKQLAQIPPLPKWAIPGGDEGKGGNGRLYANGRTCSKNNWKPFDAYAEAHGQPPQDYDALKTWATASHAPVNGNGYVNGNGHHNGKSLDDFNDEFFG